MLCAGPACAEGAGGQVLSRERWKQARSQHDQWDRKEVPMGKLLKSVSLITIGLAGCVSEAAEENTGDAGIDDISDLDAGAKAHGVRWRHK